MSFSTKSVCHRKVLISDTDRTKFFEFIIPVIPIINSTNSGEIFLQKLEESEKKGIFHEISQEFILDVSPYVEDMRILQNIYNEFVVYKETIRTDQELKLSDETMMALIIFKNLYPREFAELQMERGVRSRMLRSSSSPSLTPLQSTICPFISIPP